MGKLPAVLALGILQVILPAWPAFGADPSAVAAAPAALPLAGRLSTPPRANHHPMVLVHGFLGWAEDGPAGLNYWGGCLDLAGELRALGYPAYAVAVGPVSSNWDRACELYAALRGGRVDYGQAHARAAGHGRFGRVCPGLLPDWGESRRVHLVGHSMGGLTSRLLVELLEEGDEAERAVTPPQELSPLFAGGHSGAGAWVRSVTTLASPHDGTPAVYHHSYNTSARGLRRFAAGLYYRGAAPDAPGPARRGGPRCLGLDLRLEAWGLEPAPGESPARFRRRFARAEDWWRSRDTGLWDGSPQGARELNLRVAARPEVYYFSWATEQTTRDPLSRRQVPEPGMSFLIYSLAAFIGASGSDPEWWSNDGIVSTCSMDGPTRGSADRIEPWAGGEAGGAAGEAGGTDGAGEAGGAGAPAAAEPRPGIWNFMGVLSSCDHLDLIGLPAARARPAGYASLTEFYAAVAALLAGLPE